jgi:hypothetical protein
MKFTAAPIGLDRTENERCTFCFFEANGLEMEKEDMYHSSSRSFTIER